MDESSGYICTCTMSPDCRGKLCNEGLGAQGLFSCCSTGIFEENANYSEPYMDDLVESLAGAENENALGDVADSDSYSLYESDSDSEFPWKTMCLAEPGSYTIETIPIADERIKQHKKRMRPCACPMHPAEIPKPYIIEVPVDKDDSEYESYVSEFSTPGGSIYERRSIRSKKGVTIRASVVSKKSRMSRRSGNDVEEEEEDLPPVAVVSNTFIT